MTTADTGPRPGDVIGGKLRVERVIGRGGMAVVVAATHVELDERVAVKLLLPELASRADIVERFLREARAAVKIKGEHVVRVSDVGRQEGGAPYMVMEYLEGNDLADLVAERALPVEDVCEYALQICDALAPAHALGMVHRDLKPSNLFITRREDGSPCLKVLDFGISKTTGANDSITQTSATLGTPLYMSPEQMASTRAVDPRADIWAIGVTMYELLAAEPPFKGESTPQVCHAVLSTQPRPLREIMPLVPAELDAVVLRCLEKDAGRRFPDVAELAAALAPLAPERARGAARRASRALGKPGAGTQVETRLTAVSARTDASADTIPISAEALASVTPVRSERIAHAANRPETQREWDEPIPAPPRRSRLPVLAAAGVVVVALAAFAYSRARREEPPPVEPTADSASAAATTIAPATAPVLPTVDPAGTAEPASSASAEAASSAPLSRASRPPPSARAPASSRPIRPPPSGSADPFGKRTW